MSNVVRLTAGGLVTRDQQQALEEMDLAIARAIDTAKSHGIPKGLIVAVIQSHNFVETQKMVTGI